MAIMSTYPTSSYTLSEAKNRHGEVFDHAAQEPVLITKKSRPSHVVLSALQYGAMRERLEELEDVVFGQAATKNLLSSPKIGTETFTQELLTLANVQG
jgi:prevent-host-death family protein